MKKEKKVDFLVNYVTVMKYTSYKLQMYMGADKSLARPGRKQANVSVRMA